MKEDFELQIATLLTASSTALIATTLTPESAVLPASYETVTDNNPPHNIQNDLSEDAKLVGMDIGDTEFQLGNVSQASKVLTVGNSDSAAAKTAAKPAATKMDLIRKVNIPHQKKLIAVEMRANIVIATTVPLHLILSTIPIT